MAAPETVRVKAMGEIRKVEMTEIMVEMVHLWRCWWDCVIGVGMYGRASGGPPLEVQHTAKQI